VGLGRPKKNCRLSKQREKSEGQKDVKKSRGKGGSQCLQEDRSGALMRHNKKKNKKPRPPCKEKRGSGLRTENYEKKGWSSGEREF